MKLKDVKGQSQKEWLISNFWLCKKLLCTFWSITEHKIFDGMGIDKVTKVYLSASLHS